MLIRTAFTIVIATHMQARRTTVYCFSESYSCPSTSLLCSRPDFCSIFCENDRCYYVTPDLNGVCDLPSRNCGN